MIPMFPFVTALCGCGFFFFKVWCQPFPIKKKDFCGSGSAPLSLLLDCLKYDHEINGHEDVMWRHCVFVSVPVCDACAQFRNPNKVTLFKSRQSPRRGRTHPLAVNCPQMAAMEHNSFVCLKQCQRSYSHIWVQH